MKRCPTCRQTYTDETLKFCRDDGATLVPDSSLTGDLPGTLTLPQPGYQSITQQLPGHTPSIAVLPFVNMSADPENEYFCDGLAEELINALTKIERLRVLLGPLPFHSKVNRPMCVK
jgi:hypothetical protein